MVNRGTFLVDLRTKLQHGANMMTARYALSIKSDSDKEEKCWARYVPRRHFDITKHNLVHVAQTIQCVPVYILLEVMKMKGLHILIAFVQLAYL